MILPFNTFTIHNLVGFMVTASLAVTFYLVYFGMGRRLLDLLSANFIASISVMCLVSFITDNLVPAGMPATGWPGGPTGDQLARATVEAHRFLWAAGLITIPTKLHFALHFSNRGRWLLARIKWVYLFCLAAMPLVWTSVWLAPAPEPFAPTSSWNVAIPWMPVTGWPLLPFTVAWYGVTGYSVWVLWRTRHETGEAASEYAGQRRLVFWAFAAQMILCMSDLIFIFIGYNGVSLIPVGGMVMGVLLAVALFRARLTSYRQRIRLESEKAAILQSVPQPLVYFDRDFRVQWSNTAAGPTPSDWARPAGPARAVVEQALSADAPVQGEVALDGDSTWIIHASPVHGAGGAAAGSVMLALDITRIRWADRTLREANVRMLAAREEERRMLAGDLHDSLAQGLATLKLSLDVAAGACDDDSPEGQMLTASSEQCRGLVQEVRAICHNLYPPALDSFGLPTALRRLLRDVERTGIACRLECHDAIDARRFPPQVEIALFRVAQEAVSNAIRHGQAASLHVTLTMADDTVALTVEDDGAGFDPDDRTRHGLGMNTMNSRIEGIGGELAIQSEPGRTCVRACVPHATGIEPADAPADLANRA